MEINTSVYISWRNSSVLLLIEIWTEVWCQIYFVRLKEKKTVSILQMKNTERFFFADRRANEKRKKRSDQRRRTVQSLYWLENNDLRHDRISQSTNRHQVKYINCVALNRRKKIAIEKSEWWRFLSEQIELLVVDIFLLFCSLYKCSLVRSYSHNQKKRTVVVICARKGSILDIELMDSSA